MNLRTSARRWLIAAAAITCVAIGVPAVAFASSGSPSSAAAKPCAQSSTYVWLALSPNGAAGTIYYPVEFTNLGSTTCTLFGFPGVSAINSKGHQLGFAATRVYTPAHAVTLKHGQTAHALLGIAETGLFTSCHVATAFGLKVYPPGQKVKQFVSGFTFQTCTNQHVLSVYPVTPGIGVP